MVIRAIAIVGKGKVRLGLVKKISMNCKFDQKGDDWIISHAYTSYLFAFKKKYGKIFKSMSWKNFEEKTGKPCGSMHFYIKLHFNNRDFY